jgi:hypothetical protein
MNTKEKIAKTFEKSNNRLDENFAKYALACRMTGKNAYAKSDEFEKLDRNFVKLLSCEEIGGDAELEICIGRWDKAFYHLTVTDKGIFVKSHSCDNDFIWGVIHELLFPIFYEAKFKYQKNCRELLLSERDAIMRKEEKKEVPVGVIKDPLATANYLLGVMYGDSWRMVIENNR